MRQLSFLLLILGLTVCVEYGTAQCDKEEEVEEGKLRAKRFKKCGDFKSNSDCLVARNGPSEKEVCSACCEAIKEGQTDGTTPGESTTPEETTEPTTDGGGDDNGDDNGDDGNGGGGGDCFSSDEIVTTEDGNVPIEDIVGIEGINVLAMDRAGNIVFSPVLFWAHTETEANREYVTMKLHGSTSKEIALTERHLIHTVNCNSGGDRKTVFAKNVKVGDCLLSAEDGALYPRPVSAIKFEIRRGLLAPMTATGSIIVNGVAASCYAEVENEVLSHYSIQWFLKVKQMLPIKYLKSMGAGLPVSSPIRYLATTAPKMCF